MAHSWTPNPRTRLTTSQKKFTDAVNGKSGLTFFAAQKSEVRNHVMSPPTSPTHAKQQNSAKEINELFPEVLRDPILRSVQFSTVSRIDDLGKFLPVLPIRSPLLTFLQ